MGGQRGKSTEEREGEKMKVKVRKKEKIKDV